MDRALFVSQMSAEVVKSVSEVTKKGGFEPPDAGDAPDEVKEILAGAYSSCRSKWVKAHPGDKENKGNKTRCAKIAWGAVKNAGWVKDAKGNWKKAKKESLTRTNELVNEICKVVMAEFGLEWVEEGGPGSGYWGHKGRPGKWGGSAPGGVVSGGRINMEKYRKLSDGAKEGVLTRVTRNYSERYIPVARMKGASSEAAVLNKKIGAFEGIRRAYMLKAGKLFGKERRAVLHACVNLQNRADVAARQRDSIMKTAKAA